MTVKEGLQVVGGEVLHVGIGQTRPSGEEEQITHKLVHFIFHGDLHQGLQFLFRKETPVHVFGTYQIARKGIDCEQSRVACNGNNVLYSDHVHPYRIGTTAPHTAQIVFKAVDEGEVQLLQRNILTLVLAFNILPHQLVEVAILVVCPLRPAVAHLAGKLCVMPGKEFEQCVLFYPDTQVGIFHLFGCGVTLGLHHFPVAVVHRHTDLFQPVVCLSGSFALPDRFARLAVP